MADYLGHGYKATGWLKTELHDLQRTSLPTSCAWAVADQLLIVGCGVASYFIWTDLTPWIAFIIYLPIAVASARQMRALECLVHEGSHFNWTRKRRLNDFLVNLFAAWPVLSEVDRYRQTHSVHHTQLGSDQDTDLARWRELHLDELERGNVFTLTFGLLRRLVPYVLGWWSAIGVRRGTVLRFVLWHGAFIVIAGLVTSWWIGLLVWILGWLLPFALILPIVRFVGEIEEHRYDGVDTVIEATYTNVGLIQRLVFHPHGDAYHTFHHLFAGVPFYRVGRVHRRLMADNLGGYRDLVTQRHGIMAPSHGITSVPTT